MQHQYNKLMLGYFEAMDAYIKEHFGTLSVQDKFVLAKYGYDGLREYRWYWKKEAIKAEQQRRQALGSFGRKIEDIKRFLDKKENENG
jgi:hypothetical protein